MLAMLDLLGERAQDERSSPTPSFFRAGAVGEHARKRRHLRDEPAVNLARDLDIEPHGAEISHETASRHRPTRSALMRRIWQRDRGRRYWGGALVEGRIESRAMIAAIEAAMERRKKQGR